MPVKASPTAKRPRLYVDVTPETRRRIKAAAAMDDLTVSEFVLACVMDRLTEEEDARVGYERAMEEHIPWETVRHGLEERHGAISS